MDKKFGLENRYIEFLIDILDRYINDKNAKYYIFGSRATGEYRKYSDIDIAIDLAEKADEKIIAKIKAELSNSVLPYSIDIVDLNNVEPKYKRVIKDSLVRLN